MFVTNGGREVEGQVAEHDFAQVRNYNHVDDVDDIDDDESSLTMLMMTMIVMLMTMVLMTMLMMLMKALYDADHYANETLMERR